VFLSQPRRGRELNRRKRALNGKIIESTAGEAGDLLGGKEEEISSLFM
jgi:hypothetical protein